MRWRVMGAVLAVVCVSGAPATAQAPIPDGSFARSASGNVYFTSGSLLIPVAVYPITDEQIGGYTIPSQWIIMQNSATTTGPRPEWAAGTLAAEAQPSAPGGAWARVTEFSGNGTKTTAPFTVTAQRWRAVWTVKATSSGHNQLCLTATNLATGRSAINGCQDGDGENYAYSGGGEHTLRVSGVNDGWTVRIEQQT